MTVRTLLDRARELARAEREAATRRHEAYDEFLDRVASVPPASAPATETPAVAGTAAGRRTGDDRRREVRAAFAETVGPHGADEGSTLGTIRAELGESVAVALAPTTAASLTPELRRGVRSAAESRRAESEALRRALDRELDRLDDAAGTVGRLTDWLASADETPLSELGFDALADRHERLATGRERCDRLAERRQAFLREVTSSGVDAGVRHRSVAAHVYTDLPTDHPVLTTAVRLDATCARCQRAVRDHLTRRA
jgi:hypothetical protein